MAQNCTVTKMVAMIIPKAKGKALGSGSLTLAQATCASRQFPPPCSGGSFVRSTRTSGSNTLSTSGPHKKATSLSQKEPFIALPSTPFSPPGKGKAEFWGGGEGIESSSNRVGLAQVPCITSGIPHRGLGLLPKRLQWPPVPTARDALLTARKLSMAVRRSARQTRGRALMLLACFAKNGHPLAPPCITPQNHTYEGVCSKLNHSD